MSEKEEWSSIEESDFSQAIERIRLILEECFRQEDRYWEVAESKFTESLFQPSYALSYACRMTTGSCFILARESCIYDAAILRRSIINGTLKFLYLLTAPSREAEEDRIKEYTDLLPKRQFASNEQPIKKAFAAGHYGKGETALFAKKYFVDYIDRHKTQQTEGGILREIQGRWNYGNLSKLVAKECAQWDELHLSMDKRYAAANDYVHWNATGCYEVMANLAKSATIPNWEKYIRHCFPLDILFDMCSLSFIRPEVLAKRLGESYQELDEIIRKNKAWLNGFSTFQDKTRQDIMHALDK